MRRLFKTLLIAYICMQQTLIGLASNTEQSEKVQAVFQETTKKVQMYRNFNLALIAVVVVLIVAAIVIRIYTDKEILSRKIIDRRYEGVTEKEEIEEAISSTDSDNRDKQLDNTVDRPEEAKEFVNSEPISLIRTTVKTHRDKPIKSIKQIKQIDGAPNFKQSSQLEESGQELNSDKPEEIQLTYVPKKNKVEEIEKPQIRSDLIDELDSIRQEAEQAKRVTLGETKSQQIKTETSKQKEKIAVTPESILRQKNVIDESDSNIDPSDVIIEGEQLNLKPSEIDIEYTPKLNLDLLKAETGDHDIEDSLGEGTGANTEGSIEDSTADNTATADINNTQDSDDVDHSLDLLLLDIDEPEDEDYFIGQGGFVYRPDRPRLHPRVMTDEEFRSSQQSAKKQSKREHRREQRLANKRAARQANNQVSSKPKVNKQKVDDNIDKRVAELERQYSDQDYS